jgi:hypothetical protein
VSEVATVAAVTPQPVGSDAASPPEHYTLGIWFCHRVQRSRSIFSRIEGAEGVCQSGSAD